MGINDLSQEFLEYLGMVMITENPMCKVSTGQRATISGIQKIMPSAPLFSTAYPGVVS